MPRFKPGQSGNPKGRPPGGASLAERIRAKCGDNGDGYVDMLHDLAMDEQQPTKFRIDAVKILLDRGFGKPPQEISVTSGVASMSDEELEALPQAKLDQLIALSEQADAILAEAL